MLVVTVDASDITSFDTFHDVFRTTFGFPDFYGANMDAWIDCMTSIDEPEAALTSVHCQRGEMAVIHLQNATTVADEVFEALNNCAAFVNWRRMEAGGRPVLALSYSR